MASKKRSTYVSKGERSPVSKAALKAARDGVSEIEKELHKIAAWKAGKNPWMTFKNTATGSNRPYYKMRANDVMGDPRNRGANLYGKEKGTE